MYLEHLIMLSHPVSDLYTSQIKIYWSALDKLMSVKLHSIKISQRLCNEFEFFIILGYFMFLI